MYLCVFRKIIEDDCVYPFKDGDVLLFLGEIEQMPYHCAVAARDGGRVFWGFHTDNFDRLKDEDC